MPPAPTPERRSTRHAHHARTDGQGLTLASSVTKSCVRLTGFTFASSTHDREIRNGELRAFDQENPAHEIADPTGLQVLKKCRVSGRRHFCHPTSFQGRGCENGRSTEARQVDRERKTPSTQVPRGAKQIVIPMTQQQCDDVWHHADRVRGRKGPSTFPWYRRVGGPIQSLVPESGWPHPIPNLPLLS